MPPQVVHVSTLAAVWDHLTGGLAAVGQYAAAVARGILATRRDDLEPPHVGKPGAEADPSEWLVECYFDRLGVPARVRTFRPEEPRGGSKAPPEVTSTTRGFPQLEPLDALLDRWAESDFADLSAAFSTHVTEHNASYSDSGRTLLLVGGPGVGKTFATTRLALRQLQAHRASAGVSNLPVRVTAKELERALDGRDGVDRVWDAVADVTATQMRSAKVEDTHVERWCARLTDRFNAGRVLLIVDGLDECRNPQTVYVAIHEGVSSGTRSRNAVVVATRPTAAVRTVNLPRWEIGLLDAADTAWGVAEFIRRWFGGAHDRLTAELRRRPALAELARIPQLAGVLCRLWLDDGELPDTRTGLLRRAFRRLLVSMVRKRDEAADAELLADDLIPLLAELAADTFDGREWAVPRKELGERLAALKIPEKLGVAQTMIDDLAGRYGVFIESERNPATGKKDDELRFEVLHRSFAEWLCALGHTRHGFPESVEPIRFLDPRFREVWTCLAELLDEPTFAQWLHDLWAIHRLKCRTFNPARPPDTVDHAALRLAGHLLAVRRRAWPESTVDPTAAAVVARLREWHFREELVELLAAGHPGVIRPEEWEARTRFSNVGEVEGNYRTRLPVEARHFATRVILAGLCVLFLALLVVCSPFILFGLCMWLLVRWFRRLNGPNGEGDARLESRSPVLGFLDFCKEGLLLFPLYPLWARNYFSLAPKPQFDRIARDVGLLADADRHHDKMEELLLKLSHRRTDGCVKFAVQQFGRWGRRNDTAAVRVIAAYRETLEYHRQKREEDKTDRTAVERERTHERDLEHSVPYRDDLLDCLSRIGSADHPPTGKMLREVVSNAYRAPQVIRCLLLMNTPAEQVEQFLTEGPVREQLNEVVSSLSLSNDLDDPSPFVDRVPEKNLVHVVDAMRDRVGRLIREAQVQGDQGVYFPVDVWFWVQLLRLTGRGHANDTALLDEACRKCGLIEFRAEVLLARLAVTSGVDGNCHLILKQIDLHLSHFEREEAKLARAQRRELRPEEWSYAWSGDHLRTLDRRTAALIESLARLGNPRRVDEALVWLKLQHPAPRIRGAALRLAGRRGLDSPDTTAHLFAELTRERTSYHTLSAAAEALVRLAPLATLIPLLEGDPAACPPGVRNAEEYSVIRLVVLNALADHGVRTEADADALRPLLGRLPIPLRFALFRSLGEFSDVEDLLGILRSSTWQFVQMLPGTIGEERADLRKNLQVRAGLAHEKSDDDPHPLPVSHLARWSAGHSRFGDREFDRPQTSALASLAQQTRLGYTSLGWWWTVTAVRNPCPIWSAS